eukprot:5213-Heterococcus_DN1.PRE.3
MAQEQQQQQLPAQVLFAGSFSSSGKDEVVFSRPVVVTDVQVVASNMLAHEILLPDFRGLTQASPFQIEVFCKDVQHSGKHYFEQLLPPTQIIAGRGSTHSTTAQLLTDHVVLRGSYSALSLVLYGQATPPLPVSAPKPPAVAAPPVPAYVPPTPPRQQPAGSAFQLSVEGETAVPAAAVAAGSTNGAQPLTSPLQHAAPPQLPPDVALTAPTA